MLLRAHSTVVVTSELQRPAQGASPFHLPHPASRLRRPDLGGHRPLARSPTPTPSPHGERAVVRGAFPQVPTPSCAAGNRQAKPAASAPARRATAEVAARAVGGCRKKRAGEDRAKRPMAVQWRDGRGSHLKQGGSSNTSTRPERKQIS